MRERGKSRERNSEGEEREELKRRGDGLKEEEK